MDRIIQPKGKKRKKVLGYLVIAVIGILVAGLIFKDAGQKRFKVQSDRLSVATVSQGSFQDIIPLQGEVIPTQSFLIDAIEGGQVDVIYLEGGEMIKAGDLILKLSNPNLELNYMNLTTGLLEQMNNLRNTRILLEETGLNLRDQFLGIQNQIDQLSQEYDRSKMLYNDSVIPEADFIKVQNDYQYNLKRRELINRRIQKDSLLKAQQVGQLERSMGLIEQNLLAIQNNLGNLTIKAPVDGQMSSIRVEIGETVNPGQHLGQIDVLNGGYKIRAKVDEHYNGRVSAGQRGRCEFNGGSYELVIRKVYPEVLEGTFEVDMIFGGQAPEGIKRGQNLNIRLALDDPVDAIMVPRSAFVNASGGQYIYVLNDKETEAFKTPIQLGRQNDRYFEVIAGLSPGDRVVISSYDTFDEADKLQLVSR